MNRSCVLIAGNKDKVKEDNTDESNVFSNPIQTRLLVKLEKYLILLLSSLNNIIFIPSIYKFMCILHTHMEPCLHMPEPRRQNYSKHIEICQE